jgi:hypothetical protein
LTQLSAESSHDAPRTAAAVRTLARYEDLVRIALVPLFVVLCYRFEWMGWRALVTDAVIGFLSLVGAPAFPLAPDRFACGDEIYRIDVTCTMLDAFFGSIPLLWQWRRSLFRNLLYLAVFFVCVSVLNLVRLALGFVLHFQGVSWFWADEVLTGVFHFALFLYIARQRGWTSRVGRAVGASRSSPKGSLAPP